jgi:hypothetical protein
MPSALVGDGLEREATALGVLKEQFALVTFLVLYVGLVHTEAYYSRLSVSYQFLDLPLSHLVHRGLGSLFSSPYLLLPYALAVASLAFARNVFLGTVSAGRRLALMACLVGALILITYPLARFAGTRAALADLHTETCRLPRIVNLERSEGEPLTLKDGYRLLLIGKDYVVIFKPLPRDATNIVSNIIRFATSTVNVLETI